MIEVLPSDVDLTDLNEKQLAREFKTVRKHIKSKDLDVRSTALQKVSDVRYFSIGGCLVPLIESIIPKKKFVLENGKLLGIIESFVGDPVLGGSPNATLVQRSIRCVLEDHGDLNLLGRIAELLVYEEKLKVPKAKKGLPIELLEESDAAIFLRYASLKSICSIISSLSAPNDVDSKLAEAFSCVTGLVESICPLMQSLSVRYDDDLKKDGMLKEGLWGLRVLTFILRMNPLALQVLVSSPLIATLRKFATEECFSLHCLQIFEIITLSQVASSIMFIDEETVDMIASILLQATEESTSRADIVVIPNAGTSAAIPGKGKSAKKEKTLPPLDAYNLTGGKSEKSDAFKQTRRQKLACFKVASHTLTSICDSKSTALTPCLISRLVLYFSKTLLNRSAWELATAPTAEPYDVDLSDVFNECCIFLGTLGLLESAQRRAACDAGVVPLLMTAMQSAMAIFGCMPTNPQEAVVVDDAVTKKDKSRMSAGAARGKTIEVVRGPEIGTSDDEPNKLIKVMKLRRIAEKSIMNLLTDSIRASAPSSSSHISKRWPSAGCSYRLDSALFTTASSTDLAIPEDETDGKELFPMNQLMDMISCAHDIDLGYRGLRILAGILEGLDDPGSITTILTLDTSALNIISNSVSACATALLASINLNVIDSGSKIALPNTPDSTEVEVEKKVEVEAKECHIFEDAATKTPICIRQDDHVDNTHNGKDELLISRDNSSQSEVFYYALIILEKALHSSSDAINYFATEARMASLAQILYKCGATCNRLDDTCTDPKCIPSEILEFEITLHDPRCYAWYTAGTETAPGRVLLRPLLFDIVGIIACAEGKYRISEMEGAVTGGAPLPSSSPCKEAALIATRICADAVIATILFKSRYHLQLSAEESNEKYHITAKANPSTESCLPLCVLDAALRALLNMTSMGPLGIYAVLESVADTGVQGAESSIEGSNNSAMQHLKRFLFSLMSDRGAFGDEVSDTLLEDLRASMSGMNRWTRSQYFDHLFSGTTFSTAPLTVIRSPVMWPYLAVTVSLIGLISSDNAASSIILAVKLVMTLCRTDQCADASQPVVTDSLCAFFLSMGGGLALAGALGRFGSLRLTSENTSEFADFHQNVMLFLRFLTGRGRVRETHWLQQVPTPGNPSGLKSQKAANLLKDAKAKEKEKMLKEQKKGKSLLKSEDCSIVEDVMWNTESDGSHPDPNRGPTRAFWKGLLEAQADEFHTRSVISTLLLVAIQGGLLDTVKSLIEESAGVNIADVEGVTPIMHSLLLGDASSVSAIIDSRADIDAIDKRGNPVITYACHGACIDDIAVSLFESVATTKGNIVLSNGNFSLLPLLLTAGVDTRVSTSAGNSPLHSILGLGSVTATIGGFTVAVTNGSYSSQGSNDSICSAVSALIEQNALVNACNRMGVVPLHVAAARGHRELVHILIQAGAHSNPADSGGFLPVQYVAAACPPGAPALLDLLLKHSRYRPIHKMSFEDTRTGESKEVKYKQDIDNMMMKAFDDVSGESVIKAVRLSEQGALGCSSADGLNLLHLCMASGALQLQPFTEYLNRGSCEREALLEHLLSKPCTSLVSGVDCYGMTVMHAASLLFTGLTPRRVFIERGKLPKKGMVHFSVEQKLWNIARIQQCLGDATLCSRPVPLWGPGIIGDLGSDSWTALHGAIAGDNSALVDVLLKDGQQDLDSNYYAHFLACTNAGSSVCDQIISACSSSATYSALLNFAGPCTGTARPLHLAARARNPHALSRLLRCSKVDPNARDDESDLTAVHETCLRDDIKMLQIFGQFADRLDLSSVDSRGKTCIDIAIDSKNVDMLKLLVKMRRNDVLERVLRVSGGPSLLVQLEEENLSMAHALGYVTDTGEGHRAERADDELIVICEGTVDGLVQALRDITIDDATILPLSTAPLKCLDPGHGDKLDTPNSTSIPCTVLPTTQMSLEGNQILRVLISAANDAGIPDQYHCHACFSKGLLFTEFVENENH